MKEEKQISLKIQYLLSLIPYVGIFVVAFCALYNLRKGKKQGFSVLFGYFAPIVLIVIALMAGTVLIAQTFFLDDNTAYSVAILVGMLVATLSAGLFGVWWQKQIMKKIETDEMHAFLG